MSCLLKLFNTIESRFVEEKQKQIILGGDNRMRILLELLRILFILGIFFALGWLVIGNIYKLNEVTDSYSWLGAIAILLLIFVLYRNKLQFSGWYKGKDVAKLPKSVTVTLIFITILLIILPFLLSSIFS